VIFGSWYKHNVTEDSQILSSRVRLARNISGYPFQRKLTKTDASDIVKKVSNAVSAANKSLHNHLELQELCHLSTQVFVEKHVASLRFLANELPKGIFSDDFHNTSIMVNEEDHIRIQTIEPGNDINWAYSHANKIDDLLENQLEFAFDKELGYLTACPSNVGTGLRASYMLHIPCLDKTDLLGKLAPFIQKFGMTMRGIYGEGTIPAGSIYQLSNQTTLGKTEKRILSELQIAADILIERENQALDKILTTRKSFLQDKVYRAYGILSQCRKISAKEALALLMDVRLGFFAKVLDAPMPEKPLYQIAMEVQPGHMHLVADSADNLENLEIARADYLRGIFTN